MVFLTGRIYKINPRNYSCIEKNFTEKGEKKYDEELYLVVENVRENEYGFISNVSIDFYKYIRTREKGQQRVVTYENGEIQIYNKEPIEGFIAVFGKTDFQRAVLDSVLKLCGRGALKFIVFDIDRKFDLLKQNFRDFRRIYVKKISGHLFLQDIALGGVRIELADELNRYTKRLGGRVTTIAFMFEGRWTLISSDGRIFSPSKYAYRFKTEILYKLLKKLIDLQLILYDKTL